LRNQGFLPNTTIISSEPVEGEDYTFLVKGLENADESVRQAINEVYSNAVQSSVEVSNSSLEADINSAKQ